MRSRRLEVVGERENGRARGRHAPSPLACLLLARALFLVPTTSKRLLRRLGNSKRSFGNSLRPLRARDKDIDAASQTLLTEVKLHLRRRLSDLDVNHYT